MMVGEIDGTPLHVAIQVSSDESVQRHMRSIDGNVRSS